MMRQPTSRGNMSVRAQLLEVALELPDKGFTTYEIEQKWYEMFGTATMIGSRRMPSFLKQMGYATSGKKERTRKVFTPSISRVKREKMLFDIFEVLGWNMKMKNYKE